MLVEILMGSLLAGLGAGVVITIARYWVGRGGNS